MNTREKILGKTEEFILENGIEKLTISKIAKELNISCLLYTSPSPRDCS